MKLTSSATSTARRAAPLTRRTITTPSLRVTVAAGKRASFPAASSVAMVWARIQSDVAIEAASVRQRNVAVPARSARYSTPVIAAYLIRRPSRTASPETAGRAAERRRSRSPALAGRAIARPT
jgi:hypothetical protein